MEYRSTLGRARTMPNTHNAMACWENRANSHALLPYTVHILDTVPPAAFISIVLLITKAGGGISPLGPLQMNLKVSPFIHIIFQQVVVTFTLG